MGVKTGGGNCSEVEEDYQQCDQCNSNQSCDHIAPSSI
jgi:hypothetical protein